MAHMLTQGMHNVLYEVIAVLIGSFLQRANAHATRECVYVNKIIATCFGQDDSDHDLKTVNGDLFCCMVKLIET